MVWRSFITSLVGVASPACGSCQRHIPIRPMAAACAIVAVVSPGAARPHGRSAA
jgi:hypothetical protein